MQKMSDLQKEIRHYTTFTASDKKHRARSCESKEAVLRYLSYMVAFHSITDVRVFQQDSNQEIIDFIIPKW